MDTRRRVGDQGHRYIALVVNDGTKGKTQVSVLLIVTSLSFKVLRSNPCFDSTCTSTVVDVSSGLIVDMQRRVGDQRHRDIALVFDDGTKSRNRASILLGEALEIV